jgi:hypothetical protein
MRVKISNALARMFGRLAQWAEERERRLNLCPDCGRSRYYGKACK